MMGSRSPTGTFRSWQVPIFRGITRVMSPPARFLSERAASARASAEKSVPVGRPFLARQAAIRTAMGSSVQPSFSAARAMTASPAATAWPWGMA